MPEGVRCGDCIYGGYRDSDVNLKCRRELIPAELNPFTHEQIAPASGEPIDRVSNREGKCPHFKELFP